MNKVYLKGNLGNDPELKELAGGNTLAKLRIATNETYNDKEGNSVSNTQWHSVVAWGETAKDVSKLKKGDYISLEGKLAHRSYEDKTGTKKYVTEVVMFNFEVVNEKSSV